MSEITININESSGGSEKFDTSSFTKKVNDLATEVDDLRKINGEDIKPFPEKGIDGFLSHFIITMQILQGPAAGQVITLNMPSAMQTVSRSAPFIYQGTEANHRVTLDLPAGSQLPNTISESDFLNKPDGFFEKGKETVWMQILNLDARMQDTPIGPIRIILGETVRREYSDIFQPSLGVAQALSDKNGGFPARLFFNPYAVIETNMGALRAIHGNLSYGRTVDFPPVGTPISICEVIPLEQVGHVREMRALRAVDSRIQPFARIIALAHPIDTGMQIDGAEAHGMIETMTRQSASMINRQQNP